MNELPPERLWQSMTTVDARRVADLDPVVVLPTAAIEQHGPHLPLSTDFEIGCGLLSAALAKLPHDFPVRVLPPVAIGSSIEHTRFPGTLSLDSDLLSRVVIAHGRAVARVGVRRFVIVNSHGGNRHALEAASLELRHECGVLAVTVSHFNLPRPSSVELPASEWRHGLHGGAVETAMMLHLRPDLVRESETQRHDSFVEELERANSQIGTDASARFAWLADDLHPSGVVGDATLATASMGQLLVEHYSTHLSAIIQDARAFPLSRLK